MRRGPLYMILAFLAFTIMVSLVKLAREELGALDIVVWRGTVSAPLALLFVGRLALGMKRWHVLGMRVLLGFGAMACFFTAAKGLWLADLAILTRLQPVVVALLAPLVLGSKEHGGWRVVAAIALGLTGGAVLLEPQLEVGSVFGLWALGGAMLSAGAHVAVRSLGHDNRPEGVVFWFQAGSAVLAVLGLLLLEGHVAVPPVHLVPHLIGIGVFATVGQVLMTRAYQHDSAPVVASASYVGPLWGVAADLVLFTTVPSLNVVLGGLLVVGAGALLLARAKGVSSPAKRPSDASPDPNPP